MSYGQRWMLVMTRVRMLRFTRHYEDIVQDKLMISIFKFTGV